MSLYDVIVHVSIVNLTTEPLIDLLVFNVLHCCQEHWLRSHQLYKQNDTANCFTVVYPRWSRGWMYTKLDMLTTGNLNSKFAGRKTKFSGTSWFRPKSTTAICSDLWRGDTPADWPTGNCTARSQCHMQHCSCKSIPSEVCCPLLHYTN